MGDAVGAFDKVLRPIMSDDGIHIADVTLKGVFSKKTKTVEDVIKVIRAIATNSKLPDVNKLPIKNYQYDKDNPKIIHLKSGFGKLGVAATIEFKKAEAFSDTQMAVLMDCLGIQSGLEKEPRPKGIKTPTA